MKKISSKQYASALLLAADECSDKDLIKILDNFLSILRLNKSWKRLPKIIGYLRKISDEECGILRTEVISAMRLSNALKDRLIYWLKQRTGRKEIIFQERIKPELVSGFSLKFDECILEASIKNQLDKLTITLSNN